MTATRSLACIVVTLLALSAIAAAQPSHVMKPEARAHLQRGLKLYEQAHYDDAIAELREGLAVDPQPDILYALGQAERKKGDCARAVEYYQSCLALVNDPAAAAAIKVQIERCQVQAGATTKQPFEVEPWPKDSTAAQAAPSPETPTLTTAVPSSSASSSAPSVASGPRSWSRDPLGGSAVAIGLAGVVAGGVMVGLARSRLDVARDSYQQYSDARGWPGVWTGGVVSMAVGGALVVLGVVRYAVVAKQARGAR